MADAFVTLISVEPAVAVQVARSKPQNVPQAPPTGPQASGIYEGKRQSQIGRTKLNPPGAK